ncbi:hypothetical protein K505DRAFT_341402 [Melanomma pulvis-pyrius CBS 109.77]|uniref:Uncharacterized protein n=1 Tax=Melanomma pulvis-pyrius CBS 109.77 TaxID=1314802 RepID=A0A6A6WZE3_9PLEO|nr:hypothetical protein K505DRAFT_341402 [Melanomma pulvis-pyrius CBS 109.77]
MHDAAIGPIHGGAQGCWWQRGMYLRVRMWRGQLAARVAGGRSGERGEGAGGKACKVAKGEGVGLGESMRDRRPLDAPAPPHEPHTSPPPSRRRSDVPMAVRQLPRQHTRVRDGEENASGCPKRRAPHSIPPSPRQTAAGWRWLGSRGQILSWPPLPLRIGPHIRHSSMLAKSGSNAVLGAGWQAMLIYGCARRRVSRCHPSPPSIQASSPRPIPHRLTLSISSDPPRPPDQHTTSPPAAAPSSISDAAAHSLADPDATDSTTALDAPQVESGRRSSFGDALSAARSKTTATSLSKRRRPATRRHWLPGSGAEIASATQQTTGEQQIAGSRS